MCPSVDKGTAAPRAPPSLLRLPSLCLNRCPEVLRAIVQKMENRQEENICPWKYTIVLAYFTTNSTYSPQGKHGRTCVVMYVIM